MTQEPIYDLWGAFFGKAVVDLSFDRKCASGGENDVSVNIWFIDECFPISVEAVKRNA